MVGLIPLFAVDVLEPAASATGCPGFKQRVAGSSTTAPDLARARARWGEPGRAGPPAALAGRTADRLRRVLRTLLDEAEFLRPYGIRALSRFHRESPLRVPRRTATRTRSPTSPAESDSGPLRRELELARPGVVPGELADRSSRSSQYHHYYGDDFKVECPTGSGRWLDLYQVAARARGPAGRDLPAGRERAAAGASAANGAVRRPALAGPPALLRVLPRRQRGGHRREPPDRLDRRWWPC